MPRRDRSILLFAPVIALAGIAALCFPRSARTQSSEVVGEAPLASDGRRLNLDLEFGNLRDWTATGDAFDRQPIWGDTVRRRRSDMRAQLTGERWIGTYEIHEDAATGTLTSIEFPVTHPFATFLVGGGDLPGTRIEVVRADSGNVIHTARGSGIENLRPSIVDLREHVGASIFVRIVDEETGPWGHINYDDFRFHAEKPSYPDWIFSSEGLPAVDAVEHAGLSPAEAVVAMTVPEGFHVDLVASEPDIRQPVAFTIDARGRLWIAEAHTYPQRVGGREGAWNAGRDRIVILADEDGDGSFESRKTFAENLNLVSGIEVGFGGVWLGAAPYLLYLPDHDRDDVPDGPAEILLDGFDIRDAHETPNAFIWGPDGWLYGCHGVFNYSSVGRPGTPDAERVPINAGVWRYHPTRHVFEVFAWGTSNPWGIDFDDQGQAFITACVVPHLYHVIQNGRYQRQAGFHFGAYVFDDLKHIGDHLHFLGGNPHAGNNRSGAAGGGHAHCGAMIYLADEFPPEFRGGILMNNVHGNRVNSDRLEPRGSGFVGRHGPDLLLANDRWHRGIALRAGPDGAVYLIDWYDRQACHRNEPEIWDRSNGRVYRIHFGDHVPASIDVESVSSLALAELALARNDWYVRTARRVLAERTARGEDVAAAHQRLGEMLDSEDPTRALRALWALHASGGLGAGFAIAQLASRHEHVRAWAVQLLCEEKSPPRRALARFVELARTDPSPVVRLYLASALARIEVSARWPIAAGLLSHAADADDVNLPLLYWYGVEPLAGVDASRALALGLEGEIPLVLSYMVRRIAAADTPESLSLLVSALAATPDAARQRTILSGIEETLRGRRRVEAPPSFAEVWERLGTSVDPELRARVDRLAVIFGDARAVRALQRVALDASADAELRREAIVALVDARIEGLGATLLDLLADPVVRIEAIRGLGRVEVEEAPGAITELYASLAAEERRVALGTLSSRSPYARVLLDAVGAGRIPSRDLSADIIRQLRVLGDSAVDKRLGEVWGVVRELSADSTENIAKIRALVNAGGRARDLSRGRAIFAKTCAQCHTLFGAGAKVGPDLTGSNRADFDYVLSNVLDPSAILASEYKPWVFALKGGEIVTGLLVADEASRVRVATTSGNVDIQKGDILSREQSDASMMPNDLLATLEDEEIRDLIAYLASPVQVPLLATAENVSTFFDGKSLSGFQGAESYFSVENGEIVGRSPGISRNEFLRSDLLVRDFRLRLEVKLVPDSENSGIQFRSAPLENGEVKGHQADIGKGWWGKLYEEHGRGLVWEKSGDEHVRRGDWNEYEIVAIGSRIVTKINGQVCVDLDDPAGAREGIIAFQIHSGGAMEVRFRRISLELDPVP
jgi:putative membrane-bound dehydrogenase-like protein